MDNKLLKIINTYGILPQLKYFQSEIYELNEAIIQKEYRSDKGKISHIAEEIADVQVMLRQIQLYYGISDENIKNNMLYKIQRQINRIEVKENEK